MFLQMPRFVRSLVYNTRFLNIQPPSKTLSNKSPSSVLLCPPKLYRQPTQHAKLYSSQHKMNNALVQYCDPYDYTTGKWLVCDELERESRHISFNFDALCRKVIQLCHGAQSIVTCDKKEGGFNRVFIYTMDNAKRIVAKLPFALAGPPQLATNSEVATIKYLQRNTTIPIPQIIEWSDNVHNAVGSEYIIMEHAAGVPLHQKWPTMKGDQQIRCIDAILNKIKEAVDASFPGYGSLYFLDSPCALSSKLQLDETFCIGPHCGTRYWDCSIADARYYHLVKPNCGPWTDLAGYTDGLIDTGISRIPQTEPALENRPPYQGSFQTHLEILAQGRTVLKKMAANRRLLNTATPTLFHPDLHKRNVFVSDDDPTVVTSIIDWQSASIEPAFWYADWIPDFAAAPATPLSEDQPDTQAELCAQAFDTCVQYYLPKLSVPKLLDENLFRPFRYCYRTWKDGAVAFRHDLIKTSQHWNDLGFAGVCPFPFPSADDLTVHQKEYKLFQAAQDLKSGLTHLLNAASDGWVPLEDWETTQAANKKFFEGMVQDVSSNENPDEDEPIKTEADVRAIWPFDL